MPMDAWQENGEFFVAFDLPGVSVDSVDLDIERNEHTQDKLQEIGKYRGRAGCVPRTAEAGQPCVGTGSSPDPSGAPAVIQPTG